MRTIFFFGVMDVSPTLSKNLNGLHKVTSLEYPTLLYIQMTEPLEWCCILFKEWNFVGHWSSGVWMIRWAATLVRRSSKLTLAPFPSIIEDKYYACHVAHIHLASSWGPPKCNMICWKCHVSFLMKDVYMKLEYVGLYDLTCIIIQEIRTLGISHLDVDACELEGIKLFRLSNLTNNIMNN